MVDEDAVTLVIPGRNCAGTLHDCLEAVITILQAGRCNLQEIIFVDDDSTDASARIAGEFPVRVLTGSGGGPGAARNVGWRAATTPLVWFIDSDCVARPDALDLLLPHLSDPRVGGVGGSYGNMCPESLLACVIHEEIMLRHARMSSRVNFLGGFNVIYRRNVLEQVGGFDEGRFNGRGSPGAEDAELSYRVAAAGNELRFEPRSVVRHFHPKRLSRYLRSQRHHGYWRVFLHIAHRHTTMGDDYSSWVDHAQPALAILMLACLPLLATDRYWTIPVGLAGGLAALQLPLAMRLFGRMQNVRYLAFVPIGFLRSIWRGIGMVQGVVAYLLTSKAHRTGSSA